MYRRCSMELPLKFLPLLVRKEKGYEQETNCRHSYVDFGILIPMPEDLKEADREAWCFRNWWSRNAVGTCIHQSWYSSMLFPETNPDRKIRIEFKADEVPVPVMEELAKHTDFMLSTTYDPKDGLAFFHAKDGIFRQTSPASYIVQALYPVHIRTKESDKVKIQQKAAKALGIEPKDIQATEMHTNGNLFTLQLHANIRNELRVQNMRAAVYRTAVQIENWLKSEFSNVWADQPVELTVTLKEDNPFFQEKAGIHVIKQGYYQVSMDVEKEIHAYRFQTPKGISLKEVLEHCFCDNKNITWRMRNNTIIIRETVVQKRHAFSEKEAETYVVRGDVHTDFYRNLMEEGVLPVESEKSFLQNCRLRNIRVETIVPFIDKESGLNI